MTISDPPASAPRLLPPCLAELDATAARRWAVLSRSALATHRRAIDSLNVFPVPDGDTGTNLYLTFDAALSAARDGEDGPTSLQDAAAALARATLTAARGNSGVILSQIVQGLAEVVASEHGALGGAGLARALVRASELASASVSRPAPGTILSVAARAAAAATSAAQDDGSLYDVSRAALTAAREALAGTTGELAELTAAGVVDAGGVGYVLLLEALDSVVRGVEMDAGPVEGTGVHVGTTPGPLVDVLADGASDAFLNGSADGSAVAAADTDGDGAAAYEVMYLLRDTTPDLVARLREDLDALGTSVVLAGADPAAGPAVKADGRAGGAVWQVHAHVADAGAGVEAGVRAGSISGIRLTPLRANGLGSRAGRDERQRTSVGVVAWAAGPGLRRLFQDAGAVLVDAVPGSRPSAADILSAADTTGGSCVIVLPNDRAVRAGAKAAAPIAADRGVDLHVVRSRSVVQGIAAMAVFDPRASWQDNLVAMTSASSATRHGAVTVAAREALTSAGWCYQGDVLGLVDDDVATIGADLATVAGVVLDRLLGSGGEMVSIVSGADAPQGLADGVAAAARRRRRDVEVTIVDGGQPEHLLLLGVE